ncbi:unnamed protein product [Paramecium octaurelia]|uniref:non-specific serine/threonine protein kinase n=1 Tax=Paramecium octaurelia TaxID=43137 RepID=A0A8S1S073_PAROT|nr:unnamed protein product [Paramecium octaurelia]
MEKLTIDHFTLLKVIGKGSYAKVILVKKNDNKEIYAMKILKKKNIEKRKQEDHVLGERNILVEVKHPFIIKMFYAFKNDVKLYFVLEYCSGGELFNLLQKRKVFTEDQARFYAAQIVLALEHLHNHDIIYRDLKPENVLIDAQGYIRITDFGLSKRNVKGTKDAQSVCGTPEYLAPEILLKSGHGKPVDWWTLGAIIYEMLSGFPPFYTQNREELFESIKFAQLKYPVSLTPACKSLLEGLFSKNPDKRLGSKGAQEIKDHPWFLNVNWDTLLKKLYKPPFIPLVKSEVDVSNFDPEFTEQPLESHDPNSLSIGGESIGQKYQDFTYDAKLE